MSNTDVPIWEKYTLTIEEASKYFRIGEKKLRKLAEENIDSGWVIVNGNRIQIKGNCLKKSLIHWTKSNVRKPWICYNIYMTYHGSFLYGRGLHNGKRKAKR